MIGAQHERFGIHILNDGSGQLVASIMGNAGNRAANIKMEVVRRWLQGEGKEVSWKMLAQVLDTVGYKILAEDISTSLQSEG